MPQTDDTDAAKARARILELLAADEWEISERADREGKVALRHLHNRVPTRYEMVEFVIALVKGNVPLRMAPQGDPPGSTGLAWQMTDPKNIFVKLRISERRIGQEYVFIQSLHESAHSQ